MSKGKLDVNQQRASTSTDPSCRPDTDCFELVLENGQIMTRGQSSKARKNPVSNNFQNFIPKTFDVRNANGSKMAKLSSTDCVSADFPLPVPSCEMGLDQDVGMVSWMNYPNEDSLHNNYNSDFLHELSGVTINNLSTRNHLASRGKKSSINGDGPRNTIDSVVSMKHGDLDKAPWVDEKHTRNGSSEVLHFPLPLENVVPGSDICDASGSNTGATHHVASRDSVCNPSSLCAFTSLRLQKLNAGQPSTSFTNFSNFVRPRSNPSLNKLDHDDDKRRTLSSCDHAGSALVNISSVCSPKVTFSHNQSVLASVNVNSVPLPAKPTEKLLSSGQAVFREDVAKNDASQNPARIVGETNMEMEPVVATSSVCSGNNVERASNEGAQDSKRKSCETGESEDPSEELEDESVGARKASPARTGAKRIRAAEVHNLSERRRRDRINERLRALQELIPNCNKVDKASMLDEAIEYLKTLQLQVQILSMGAGLHMQPMMLPGMQPIHGSHMPHFSHMGFGMGTGMGMGMGMGYGMNMLDANIGMKIMPFQVPQYLIPVGTAFQGMPGSSLQALGHPGQGLPVSMPRAPLLPVSGVPPLKIPVGPHVLGATGPTDAAHLAPSSSSMAVGQQVMPSHNVNSFVGQASNQAANKGIECSVTSHDTSGTDTMPS